MYYININDKKYLLPFKVLHSDEAAMMQGIILLLHRAAKNN